MGYLGYQDDKYIGRFETQFDEKLVQPFLVAYWHWCFYLSAIYAVAVYLGQRYMKDRKPFQLRTALCMWSTGLSVFSFWALWRIYNQLFRMIYLGGFRHAVCDARGFIGSTGTGMWTFMFAFSKLPELCDTAFIVLRKQKLTFLHVYHHITVFIYCWYSYVFPMSSGIWFGTVNYFVHALMYAYYAYRASGRRLPRWIARSITTIQLSQMFIGLFINYLAGYSLWVGKSCQTNWFNISLSLIMYVSYVILFANFYYWTYIYKKAGTKKAAAPAETIPSSETVVKSNGHLNGVIPTGFASGNGSTHTVRERR